ncbi:MAG: hypothetical protein CMJ49_05270 [Planctomycetaceae bacterium]|nr:hypothetical protein [Planctomycetaceae bacterium]
MANDAKAPTTNPVGGTLSIEMSKPTAVSRSRGHHWFPHTMFHIAGGDIILGFSICRDWWDEDLTEGILHALLQSMDQGANWFLLKRVRHGLNDPWPSCQLADGSILGIMGALLDQSGQPYILEWRSRDGIKSWEGPRRAPLLLPDGLLQPFSGSTPGRTKANLIVFGIIELDDGRTLLTGSGAFRGDTVDRVILFETADRGASWSYLSSITDPSPEPKDFCEPSFLRLPDGGILCVMRTTTSTTNTPMYQCKSNDDGRTWSTLTAMSVTGVAPQLRLMSHGVIALSHGRVINPPSLGNQIIFSLDDGESWSDPTVIYHGASTGYTSMVEINPGRLLVAYDEQAFAWTEDWQNTINTVTINVERN